MKFLFLQRIRIVFWLLLEKTILCEFFFVYVSAIVLELTTFNSGILQSYHQSIFLNIARNIA